MATDLEELARSLGGTKAEETAAGGQDLDALAAQFGGTRAAPTPPSPEGTARVMDVPGGGRIERMPDGNLAFVSPTFSTVDPQFIADIERGASMEEAMQMARSRENLALLEQPGATLQAAGATYGKGVPFIGSWMDEAADYVAEGGGQRVRQMQRAFQEEYPGTALATEIAGGVGTGIGILGLAGKVPRALSTAEGVSRTSQAARVVPLAAGAGGIEGAVYGAGEGQEGERITPAVTGATVGATLGAAIPAGGLLLKGLTEEAIKRVKGVDVETTQEILSQELGKEVDPDTARIFQTFLAYEDMESAQKVLDEIGEPAMIAEISPGAAVVLDAIMTGSPAGMNAGRMAVNGRTTKAMQDLGQKFDDELGLPADPEDINIEIAMETAQARSELYDRAYSQTVDYSGQAGQELNAAIKEAIRFHPAIITDLNKILPAGSREIKQIVDEQGNITFDPPLNVMELDYLTRIVNDVASKEKRAGATDPMTSKKADAIVYGDKNIRGIREILKEQIPDYRLALKEAEDKLARQKAVNLGFELIDPQMTRGEFKREIKNMTPTQRAEMARGLRSRIDAELSNIAQIASEGNPDALELRQVIRKMSSNAFKVKLTDAIGAEKASIINRQIEDGIRALQLRAAVAVNSKTAQRQVVIGGTEQILEGGILTALRRGEPLNTNKLIVQALTGATEEAQAVRRAGIFEEMTQVLTQIRGQRAKDALKLIDKAMKGQPLKDSQARFIANVITMPSAVALYTAGRPEQEKQ